MKRNAQRNFVGCHRDVVAIHVMRQHLNRPRGLCGFRLRVASNHRRAARIQNLVLLSFCHDTIASLLFLPVYQHFSTIQIHSPEATVYPFSTFVVVLSVVVVCWLLLLLLLLVITKFDYDWKKQKNCYQTFCHTNRCFWSTTDVVSLVVSYRLSLFYGLFYRRCSNEASELSFYGHTIVYQSA